MEKYETKTDKFGYICLISIVFLLISKCVSFAEQSKQLSAVFAL